MPSDLITKNVDLATCIASSKPNEEVSCGDTATPIAEGKARNILRLHSQGHSVTEIARKTASCTLPNPEAPTQNIDQSPSHEARVRDRFDAYCEHVRQVIRKAGGTPNE